MAEPRQVRGLSDLLETLKRLPPEIVSKGGGPVRVAARKAMVVVQREAQANVRQIVDDPNQDGKPSTSVGLLEQSIVVSRGRLKGKKGELYRVIIKRRTLAKSGVNVAKYGGVLEFGYEGVPAKPWMRKAFESKKDEVLSTFTTELSKRIDAAAKKARKKGLIT